MNKWYKLNSSLWTLILGSSSGKPNPSFRHDLGLAYPELDSQFISHHQGVSRLSLRFVNKKHELTNTNLYIVGSSNGLVLCTTDYFDQQTCYVCNPLTKQWVSLPPPPNPSFIVVTGFTCEECCYSSSLVYASYKVIRLPVLGGGSDGFKIHIFSSDLGEWNVYNTLYPPDVSRGYSIYANLITHNGVFYWMNNGFNQLLAFSIDRNDNHQTCGNECRSIDLPDRQEKKSNFHQCLGESEGLICYAVVKDTEKSLSVWVLEENWYLLHMDTKFCDMLAQMESSLIGVASTADLIRDVEVLAFNPVDKNVVILGYKKHILAYNIRNGGYQQLSHPSFLGSKLQGPYLGILTFVLKPRPTILPPVCW